MAMDRPAFDSLETWSSQLRAEAIQGDEDAFWEVLQRVPPAPVARVIDELAPLLASPRGRGRLAAWGMVKQGKEALPVLTSLLRSEDRFVRKHAAWALGAFRQESVALALLDAIEDSASWLDVQESCLDALGELALPVTQKRMIALVPRLTSPSAISKACQVLGRVADRHASPLLVEFLEHSSGDVSLRAAEALVRIGDDRGWEVIFKHLVEGIPFDEKVSATLRSLGDLSSAAPLLLGDGDYHYALRRDAAEILGALGDIRGLKPLLAARRDPHPTVRGAVAYALGRLGDRKALAPLGEMLGDASEWVRMSAARALGLLDDKGAIPRLEAAKDDLNPDVREAVVEALRQLSI